MSQMTANDGMLQAILREPRADDLRLIWADALTESGEEERGEFVRVQCRLVELDDVLMDSGDEECGGTDCICKNRKRLRRRERELLTEATLRNWFPERCFNGFVFFTQSPRATSPEDAPWAVVRRGLIEEISLTLADFMAHAKAIFSAAPMLRVTLTDRGPTQFRAENDGGFWRWFDGSRGDGPDSNDPDELPGPLWKAYHEATKRAAITWEHPIREHALAFLSHACIAFGRQQAGLPPLTVEDVRR